MTNKARSWNDWLKIALPSVPAFLVALLILSVTVGFIIPMDDNRPHVMPMVSIIALSVIVSRYWKTRML